ncbi:MAG: cytochrome c oxidase subunit 3 [Proteobacteria bacterium]|nr:cytochrome c oxidase subunit 3 [Pseudomonadota bacterium]
MHVTLIFMAALMGVVAWWLLKQSVNTRPWEAHAHHGSNEDFSGRSLRMPDARIGLFVFLAVVTSLFALFISAYTMRMELGDWRPLPDPSLLWLNTGLLIFSSIALQWAYIATGRDQVKTARNALLVGGFFAIAFMVGQLLAWQQLVEAGYYANTNPANAFFYLITGTHALHLLGGLVAWGRTTIKLSSGSEIASIRTSVELCAVYWHFLLVIWVILFGLMLST